MIRPARNALRAAVESCFPSARYAVRVVLFAPVEYLTYGSRKAVLFARAALRITKNGLPFKSQLKQPQSISITSSVCPIRICSAFCRSKSISAQTKLRGKSKEGGRSPLLGRFKGDCQGDRAPTRIQRSDSCGKRRNNGTDDACPPQAADRMRNVEFVPTQIPLDDSFFRPSTALSFSYEKESGGETALTEAFRSIKTACAFAQNKKPPDGMSGGIFIVCLMQAKRFAQLTLRKPS